MDSPTQRGCREVQSTAAGLASRIAPAMPSGSLKIPLDEQGPVIHRRTMAFGQIVKNRHIHAPAFSNSSTHTEPI